MLQNKIKKVLYVRLPCWKIYPGGTVYVADYIHKKRPNIEQQILDMALVEPSQRTQALKERLTEMKPDVVAFSWRNMQTFGPNPDNDALDIVMSYDYSPRLSSRIKATKDAVGIIIDYMSLRINNFKYMKMVSKFLPDSQVVVGGTAVSLFAEYVIQKCPKNTIAVVGEGEDSMLSIVDGAGKIEGDCFYKDKDGKIHKSVRDRFFDLKELTAIDFHYIKSIFPEFDEYLGDYIGVQTKRGCPFKCLFCLYNSIEGVAQRYRDPLEVAKEVESLSKDFGVKKIWFTDAQFCSTPKSFNHAEQVLDQMIKNKSEVSWTGYLRLDFLKKELAAKMIKSGICSIDTTFTGSQIMVDKLNLGYKVDRQMESFKMLSESEITDQQVKLYMPLNAPGENINTLKETIDKINQLYGLFGRDNVLPFVFFIGVQPNTPIERQLIKEGYLKEGYNPLTYNPFTIKRLLYNPPPYNRPIGTAYLEALDEMADKGDYVGRATMDYLSEKLDKINVN